MLIATRSAKEAINVETAFQELTKNALKKFEDEPRYARRARAFPQSVMTSPSIDIPTEVVGLKDQPQQPQGCGC